MHLYKNTLKFIALSLVCGISCVRKDSDDIRKKNILWIYVEDLSPLMSSHGITINPTPHIDDLAKNGITFTKAFSPSPVCSPARSALITGVNSITNGTHNHRSARDSYLPIYLPEGTKTLPEYFRDEGYNTFNIGKDDYNFSYDRSQLYNVGKWGYSNERRKLFGYSGEIISFSEMKDHQPFFGQIQLDGGKIRPHWEIYQEAINDPIDPALVYIPSYYPDIPLIREFMAEQYDCVRVTDYEVGKILKGLKDNGLLENTYIFFFADHGMRSLRDKQFVYDSGLWVPFVLAYFGNDPNLPKDRTRNEMVNTLDIAATSMYLADIPVPGHFESRNLLGDVYQPREYIFGSRDRCDWTIDRIRTVRSESYRYIRNFMTDRPLMQPQYRDNHDITIILRAMFKDGKLNKEQAFHFLETRVEKELYDVVKDPEMINNLAYKDAYHEITEEYDQILMNWIEETGDRGQIPESDEMLRILMEVWGDQCQGVSYDKLRE